jgi:hypothetical protein
MHFDTSFGKVNLDEVGKTEDDWITIASQSVTIDKNRFYIDEFKSDFPNYTLLGSNDLEKFKFLSELCGRSPELRKWYASVTIRYSDTTQLPLYLKNSVAPDEYNRVQEKLLALKDKLAVIIKKRNDLSAKYSADLERINEEEREVVNKTIGDDNIVKIVSLTTESLPLSIQMRIQSYMANSSDADVADNKRRLAQEYLAKFKVALIKLSNENPNLNIDDLVSELQLK